MHLERLGDDLPHPHTRIERTPGVLEDRLYPGAVPPGPLPVELLERVAFEGDGAAGRLLQQEDQLGERGLAASGLADHPEAGPFLDLERDPVHGVERLVLADDEPARGDLVGLGEVLDLEQGGHDPAPFSACSQQAAEPPPATAVMGGYSVRHTSIANVQRGWKWHPDGSRDRSGGSPSI